VYRDVLACGDVTQLAMLDKKCIGAIACRLQRTASNKDTALLYVLTLGVVASYRNQGIGTCSSPRCQPPCFLQAERQNVGQELE
jgi:hypothetical protein